MAQRLDNPLKVSQEAALAESTLLTDAFMPSAHPPVSLPASVLPPGMTSPPVLGFAPAPTAVPADFSVPAELLAPPVRPRRRFWMGWYEIAVVLLILGCGALCIYRLMWAIQP